MTSQLDIVTNDISLNKHSGDIVFLSWILSEANGTDIDRILSAVEELFKPNGFLVIAGRFESSLVDRISRGLAETNCLDIIEHERQIGHCGVPFPDDIRDKFKVRLIADTAYWVTTLR